MAQALAIRGTVRKVGKLQEWENQYGAQSALQFELIQDEAPLKADEKYLVIYEAVGSAIEAIQNSVGKTVTIVGFIQSSISKAGKPWSKLRVSQVLKA